MNKLNITVIAPSIILPTISAPTLVPFSFSSIDMHVITDRNDAAMAMAILILPSFFSTHDLFELSVLPPPP
jgi:hypothetical protein